MAKKKKNKTTLAELERLRKRTLKRVCSESWCEEMLHHGAEYPPKADHTPMHTCKHCEVAYPFYYMTGKCCEDCRLARMPVRYLRLLTGW